MKSLTVTMLVLSLVPALQAQTGVISTGPDPGEPIPQFVAKDQNGVNRTSASIFGPKGALLVFFRSADW